MSHEDFSKDPDETLDFGVDWSKWLGGDLLVASDWTVENGLTIVTKAFTGKVATVWLSGGTLGQDYLATNTITTQAGRIKQQTLTFAIRSN